MRSTFTEWDWPLMMMGRSRDHEMQFRPGYDLVVVARSQAVNASFSQLPKAYLSLADKLNLRNEAGQ